MTVFNVKSSILYGLRGKQGGGGWGKFTHPLPFYFTFPLLSLLKFSLNEEGVGGGVHSIPTGGRVVYALFCAAIN